MKSSLVARKQLPTRAIILQVAYYDERNGRNEYVRRDRSAASKNDCTTVIIWAFRSCHYIRRGKVCRAAQCRISVAAPGSEVNPAKLPGGPAVQLQSSHRLSTFTSDPLHDVLVRR